MEVTAYNSEKYVRDHRRYIIFSSFFAIIVVLAILSKNFIGTIVLFSVLGGYLFFNVSLNQLIKIAITDTGLVIGSKIYDRGKLRGFSLEIDPDTREIKNIIFSAENRQLVHSFEDSQETIKKFIINLNEFTPMMGEIQLSSFEKIIRKLKI
ncbi:MAG TPA: hypothetical protein PKC14_04330 [Candidatus Absconditabacterales bacterium]|nr:hypothetical protein [Candidatus Absconditabacterales bacterium]